MNILHAIYIYYLLHDQVGNIGNVPFEIDSIRLTDRRDDMEARNEILPFIAQLEEFIYFIDFHVTTVNHTGVEAVCEWYEIAQCCMST